jgi:LysM repeat protein
MEKNSIFIQKHPIENEENYFAFKFHELMQMGGHYIFYEKNPAMQNYMINVRRQIGVTPSEMVEDRAAKDFRSTIRGRMEVREQRNSSRLAYMTSALLVLMVLAIGISAMNNYDKMNAVQKSIETLSESVKKVENTQQMETVAEEVIEETSEVQEEGQEQIKGMEPEVSTIQEELEVKEYYTVEKGDTLDIISQKIYGTTSETEAICKMNGLTDGNLIFIGQKLLLP